MLPIAGVRRTNSFVSRNGLVYALFFCIALLPYLKFFTQGYVPITSPDSHFFYSFFSYHHQLFHEGGIPSWNSYYGLGVDTAALDPSYNPFRLPNFFGFLFSDPMSGWVWLLIIQVFFMGVFSFHYFNHIKLQRRTAFLCSAVYMLSPLHDELIYQGYWGFTMLFAPLLLTILHKIHENIMSLSESVLWVTLVLTLAYLCAGAISPAYLAFGSMLYAAFVLVSWRRGLHELAKYFLIFGVAGIWACALGGYILVPFVKEMGFMVRAKGFYEYGVLNLSSLAAYLWALGLSVSSWIVPFWVGLHLNTREVVCGVDREFLSNYWYYINVMLLPSIIFAIYRNGLLRRYAFYFLFLFVFILNRIPLLNMDWFFAGILKGYSVRKLFMFYSLAGCAVIGYFLDYMDKANNATQLPVILISLKVLSFLYMAIVSGIGMLTIYSCLYGFSLEGAMRFMQWVGEIFKIDSAHLIVRNVSQRSEKFVRYRYYLSYFSHLLPMYTIYYASLLGMIIVVKKRIECRS